MYCIYYSQTSKNSFNALRTMSSQVFLQSGATLTAKQIPWHNMGEYSTHQTINMEPVIITALMGVVHFWEYLRLSQIRSNPHRPWFPTPGLVQIRSEEVVSGISCQLCFSQLIPTGPEVPGSRIWRWCGTWALRQWLKCGTGRKKIITVKMFMRMRMIYTNGHANVSQFVGSIYCDALLVFSSIENNSVFL